jgi:hypothetical protein
MWQPKVNRHATYYARKTVTDVSGNVNTNYIKRRPCVLTAISTDTNPELRVRHYTVPSTETYGTGSVGIVKHAGSGGGARTLKYRPG